MAVAFRATAGSVSPALPTYQTGDLLLLHVVAKSSLSSYAPAGWNSMLATNGGGGSRVVWFEAVLWKIAGSSETAPIAPTGVEYCHITSFSGVDAAAPIRFTGANVTSFEGSASNGSIEGEPYSGGDLVVAAFAGAISNNVFGGGWGGAQIGGTTMTTVYDRVVTDGTNFNRYCVGANYLTTTQNGIWGVLTASSALVGTSGGSGSWGMFPFVIAAPASVVPIRYMTWL